MKKYFIVLLMSACSPWLLAQNKSVRVVFDVTSKDTLTHQAVLRHVTGLSKAYTESDFEVVVYGGAISMLLRDKSTVAKAIENVSVNKNVAFAVCSETMKRYNIQQDQLLPGVIVVPDAIMEIVSKQGDGWGYIKESHH
jgi:intracellular sulfur oxidation DsrE/DsrF family protein